MLEISSYTSIHSTDVRVPIVEDLLLAKPEPVNVKDKEAAAVLRGTKYCSHVLHNLVPRPSQIDSNHPGISRTVLFFFDIV